MTMTSSDAGASAPLRAWFLRRRLEAPPSSRALAAGGGCGATDASASKACSEACAHRAQARHTHTHAQSKKTYAPEGPVRVAPARAARSAAPAARSMQHRRAAPAARSAAPAARSMEHPQAARPRPAPAARFAAKPVQTIIHCQAQATRGLGASPAHNHLLHACTYTHNTTTQYLRAGPKRRRL